MTVTTPAGWYADPGAAHEHRYWDGTRWTDFVADQGVQSEAPLVATATMAAATATAEPELDIDVERGLAAEEVGDTARAEAAFRRADQRGSAAAALLLGVRLARRGDRTGAEAAYRRAEARGEPRGSCNIGVLLEGDGDLVGAEAAYRRADAAGFAGGAYALGRLLQARGDLAVALAAFRRADELGDREGAFNLGVMLRDMGDLAGAAAAYRRADERGHRDAAAALGRALEQQGDMAGAEAAYRRADAAGDPNGSYGLGALLLGRDDVEESQSALRRAADGGHAGAPHLLNLLLQDAAAPPAAPTPTPPAKPALRYDGVYEYRAEESSRYIRFLADGRALGVTSAPGAAAKVARWLGPDRPNASAGVVAVDAAGGRMHFSLTSANGTVEYHGQLDADGSLVLDILSHINGARAAGQVYRFEPVDPPPPAGEPGLRPPIGR